MGVYLAFFSRFALISDLNNTFASQMIADSEGEGYELGIEDPDYDLDIEDPDYELDIEGADEDKV